MKIKFKKLAPTAKTPTRANTSDAGLDLYVSRSGWEEGRWVCHSDIAFEIPEGHVGVVFPRSSISGKSLSLANSVGVVDSGYRGEVSGKFRASDQRGLYYKEGERFAQIIIMPYPQVELVETDKLSLSERGTGGYGSSGE